MRKNVLNFRRVHSLGTYPGRAKQIKEVTVEAITN
jgi:hypothetical protein